MGVGGGGWGAELRYLSCLFEPFRPESTLSHYVYTHRPNVTIGFIDVSLPLYFVFRHQHGYSIIHAGLGPGIKMEGQRFPNQPE